MLRLVDRDVMWIDATWEQLEVLPFTAIPIAEISGLNSSIPSKTCRRKNKPNMSTIWRSGLSPLLNTSLPCVTWTLASPVLTS